MHAVLMQFRVVFRAAHRHYQRVRSTTGVTDSQLWVLAEVQVGAGIAVGALAARLSIHQSTASNLLNALEAGGLVERRREDDDRRVVRVHATARGARLLRRAPKPLRGVLQQALCDLPVDSLALLHGEMEKLLSHMRVPASAQWTLISQSWE